MKLILECPDQGRDCMDM